MHICISVQTAFQQKTVFSPSAWRPRRLPKQLKSFFCVQAPGRSFCGTPAGLATWKHLWPSLILSPRRRIMNLWFRHHFLQWFRKFQCMKFDSHKSFLFHLLPAFFCTIRTPSHRCTPHRRRHVDEKGWEVDNFTKRGACGQPHLTSKAKDHTFVHSAPHRKAIPAKHGRAPCLRWASALLIKTNAIKWPAYWKRNVSKSESQ